MSSTYDKEGMIKTQISQPEAGHPLGENLKSIKKILKNFIGTQKQLPPMFSAKKVGGKKLYELARRGLIVKRKPHQIKIYYIKLLNYKWPHLDLKIKCSSGTYIRTLGHDIGKKLGTGACLEELTRTAIGKFFLKNAVSLA